MTKVDQLPSELVSLILSYVHDEYYTISSDRNLSSCALINKTFYREAMPFLWHTISIWSKKSLIMITTSLMQSPHSPGHHVRSLSITDLDAHTEHEQDVTYIESLDSVQYIPRYCPHLTSLTIHNWKFPDPFAYHIAHATVVSAGQYCKQLTRLVLRHCVYSDHVDLFGALKDAPLTEIQLTLPRKLDTQVVERFLETAPLALHRYPLTTLTIETLKDNTSFITTINTHGLTWPHLTTFELDQCRSLTDPMGLTFVQAHPTLENLTLEAGDLTDDFLDGLVDYLPKLTRLGVNWNHAMTAAGICRLITNYDGRLLYRVHCHGCHIYSEDVPDDKPYEYYWADDDDENTEVGWFSGYFYDSEDDDSP